MHIYKSTPQSFITMSTLTSSSQNQTYRLEECRKKLQPHSHHHTSQYLSSRKNNKVTNTTPYDIHSSEQTLSRHLHTKLAQHSQQITTLAKLPTYSKP